jgi:hypothetical protein
MREALEVVLGLVVACGAIAGLATGLAFRQAHHANRISPTSASEAPLRWLVSLSRPAQLHRRLRRATRMVIAATQPFTPSPRRRHRRNRDSGVLDGAGRELIRRAVAIDGRLVACDRGGALWRRRQLPDLARDVYAFETSAARLASLSTDLRRHLDGLSGVRSSNEDDSDLGLDALEADIGELRETPQGRPAP